MEMGEGAQPKRSKYHLLLSTNANDVVRHEQRAWLLQCLLLVARACKTQACRWSGNQSPLVGLFR